MSPEYRATLRRSQLLTTADMQAISPLRLASFVLAALSICLSIAIIGTSADAYSTYHTESKALNPWWLPLWTDHFNTGGTKSLIGAAVAITVLNATYLGLCLAPKLNFHAGSFRTMISAVMLSSASSLLALASIIYSAILNRDDRSRETIQTWTCRFPSSISTGDPDTNTLDKKLTNDAFDRLCTESKFAFWALVTVLILQALLFSVAVTQWVLSLWGKTRKSVSVERPDTGTEMESQKDLKLSSEFPKQEY